VELFLAAVTFISTILAVFSDTIKKRFKKGPVIVLVMVTVLPVAALIGSYELIRETSLARENARRLIKQGEARAMAHFIAPVAFFYGDYLGGVYVANLDLSKVRSPDVLHAMQGICFFEAPKRVLSFPPRTWGDEFGGEIRVAMDELKETLSLYQAYMTPDELRVIQVMRRDSLVRTMLSGTDFSIERGNPLIYNGSCGALTPIGLYQTYLEHVEELQAVIDHGDR
jgi:hypothetical protein